MLSSSSRHLAPVLLAAFFLSSEAAAQQVEYTIQSRSVIALANAEDLDFTQVDDLAILDAPDFGVFDVLANADAFGTASSGNGLASQDSVLLPDRISAQGAATTQADVSGQGSYEGLGGGISRLVVRFEVTEPSIWSIVGDLGSVGDGFVEVRLDGPAGNLFTASIGAPDNQGIFSGGLLEPGVYDVFAIASATATVGPGNAVPAAFSEFNFLMSVEPEVQRYCTALPNVTGVPALIDWSGSTSIAADDLVLGADNLPPGVPALFFYGPGQSQMPFGNGLLCVSGGFARLGAPVFANSSGSATKALDYSSPPALPGGIFGILPSSTWNFQVWYRDPNPGTALFNATDGLQITFRP